MGLFDSLFEKKICSICGEEIGLFGNNKLEDGNMCDDCAAKLSPYFSSNRYSKTPVEKIKKQIGYRKKNKQLLKEFKTTRVIGGNGMRLLIDEKNKKFVAVHASGSIAKNNPDIIPFELILGYRMEVNERENKVEKYRTNAKGETVSYNPPRYDIDYSSDVYVYIDVRKKYFRQMKLQLNNSTIYSTNQDCSELVSYKKIGKEMLTFLEEAKEEASVVEAPKQAVTCPYCGATTVPDENGCCEYCGGAVNG